jgi:hypothetical protein
MIAGYGSKIAMLGESQACLQDMSWRTTSWSRLDQLRCPPQLDFIHLEPRWRNERLGATIGRQGFPMSRKTLDVQKPISLIINEMSSKDLMPYGNG